MKFTSLSYVLVLTWLLSNSVMAQNSAPSSHMVFDDNFTGDIIIHEVRVPQGGEATYTYYEALGWRGVGAGYAGIQAHPQAHNYIFSIWDHKSHAAPIKAVYHGAGTKTVGFGGEGTGLKSWNFELGWDTDTWYTLVLRSWAVKDHTHFGYWVKSAKTGKWTHMVTMDVAASKAYFQGGTDAFIEDWLNSGKHPRTTHLRNGWKRRLDGSWHPFGKGRYSVNYWDLEEGKRSFNYRTNWNGGVTKDAGGSHYFMVAGGAKTQATTGNPSIHTIKRTEQNPALAPIRLNSVSATVATGGKMTVQWVTDARTLPQFSYQITVYDNRAAKGEPLVKAAAVIPHARTAVVQIPADKRDGKFYAHLVCTDILDNKSPRTIVSGQ